MSNVIELAEKAFQEEFGEPLMKQAACPVCGRPSDMVDADQHFLADRDMDLFECPDGGVDHPARFYPAPRRDHSRPASVALGLLLWQPSRRKVMAAGTSSHKTASDGARAEA